MNTMNKRIRRYGSALALLHALTGMLAVGTLGGARCAAQAPTQQSGTCARVQIQLNQQVAITRTAFQATLTLGNSPANVPLQNVSVTLNIQDTNGNPANTLFGISSPTLTGLSAVNGTGTLAPGGQATASWTILPTRDAAPTVSTQYTVGGTINYTQSGVSVSLPLFPAAITVLPDPLLEFHYFLQNQVYGQDPYQDTTDPSVPFALGLLVDNAGHGTAHGLRVTSSQPQIVDNEKGLQVAFQIIGASVNGQPVTPSLQVDLGGIVPGGTSVADWLLLSSIQGDFLSFSASFTHNDDLGNPRTSILDSVDTHFLEHVVRAVDPQDDGKQDFLAFDATDPTKDMNALPDTLWNSLGTMSPVAGLTTATADGMVSNANLTIHLSVPNVPAGFFYVRVTDPGNAQYQLVSATRSDGRVLRLGDNAWTTNRIVRLMGKAPYPLNLLHLFDGATQAGTVGYTLTYAPSTVIPPMVSLTSISPGATFNPGQTVTLSAATLSTQASIAEVDYYVDNVLVGKSTTVPFSLPIHPAIGTHTIKAVVLDANGNAGTSTSETITVNAQATPPPTVALSSPAPGTTLAGPAAVSLAAAASEPGGTITQVAFYENGNLLGSSVTAPYVLPVPNLPPGTYQFTAVVTDNQARSVTSAPVTVQVQAPLTQSGMPILRGVAAVREPTAGQMMVTVENDGSMNAVNVALVAASTRWGGVPPTSISPASVPMLAPNSQTTFMLQFPPTASGPFVSLSGTDTGRSFGGMTRVTP